MIPLQYNILHVEEKHNTNIFYDTRMGTFLLEVCYHTSVATCSISVVSVFHNSLIPSFTFPLILTIKEKVKFAQNKGMMAQRAS
jgi:hypothetical protein